MDTNLLLVKKWLEPYGIQIGIFSGLVYRMRLINNAIIDFPLNKEGLISACIRAARINQDPYRKLPELKD